MPTRSTPSPRTASSIACWSSARARRAPWFEQQLPDAIFLGQQTGDDLARALASADVFLNPSITEAFGNVTLEAMACALPVVAADATGATNLVRDGVTGTLVDPDELEEFADALEAYARDPELRRRHGEAGLADRRDDGLGLDQRGGDPRLQARDRQARAPRADDRQR